MNINSFKTNILKHRETLFAQAQKSNHRQILILNGSNAWNNNYIANFIDGLDHNSIAIISVEKYQLINFHKANPNQIIGKEFDLFIFQITEEFDANLFAASTGTIKGNGLLIVSTPDELTQKKSNNLFIDRLIKKLTSHPSFHHVSENSIHLTNIKSNKLTGTTSDYSEQKEAIGKIKHVVSGHRNRPLVLLADRGRGKSAALGIAAAELIKTKLANIIITAPSYASTAVTFKHIKLEAPDCKQRGKSLSINSAFINFIAPDELLETRPKTDLLIIDEAAAIPPPLLEALLENYSRIVFATTLHGYEGSGRGFELRFFKQLDNITPGWKRFKLTQPIRWAKDDPLEEFINSTFLLNAEIEKIRNIENFNLDDCKTALVSSIELINNESLLHQIFALLTVAHYRTKPSDLMQMLSNPDSYIFITYYESKIVATAFCLKEGGLEQDLAEEIYSGNRRPKGHLIPQTLIFHTGLKEAAPLSCLRVVRIATHPFLRDRGIATQLINTIVTQSKHERIDYLGTSFGATTELIIFWKKLAFNCFRIGLKKEASSNSHALMMLRPLTAEAEIICKRADALFVESFYHLLADELRYLNPKIVKSLIFNFIKFDKNLINDYEWRCLHGFANENRSYEDSVVPLTKFIKYLLSHYQNGITLHSSDQDLLILKVLQKREWNEISKLTHLSGKHVIISRIRSAVDSFK